MNNELFPPSIRRLMDIALVVRSMEGRAELEVIDELNRRDLLSPKGCQWTPSSWSHWKRRWLAA
jgi:hypothetical protein